ncbi:MAG: glycine--tRNA ligase [Candidatus Methanomethylicia archaeon]
MDKYERLMEFARRRGFLWPSMEIYGGVRGFIDFGPLGVGLKRRIEDKWRQIFIHRHRSFIFEVETPIILPQRVLEASGHIEHFTDYIVECLKCDRKYRADHLIEQYTNIHDVELLSQNELNNIIRERGLKCPECGGALGEVKKFSLLFKTTIGPYSSDIGYGRPEAAQGIFLSFKRVYEACRGKLPIGIAQIGHVLRNEISPRQGPIRLREFTIMEVELFFDPEEPKCKLFDDFREEPLRIITQSQVYSGDFNPIVISAGRAVDDGFISNEWQAYFMVLGRKFAESLGIPFESQVFVDKPREERAHYSVQTFDQMVKVDRWGLIEIAGYSYRTDYDLSGHMAYSGVDLRVYKQFDTPKIEERVNYKPNMKVLSEKFGSNVIRILSSIDPSTLKEALESKGYVEVDGFKLESSDFIISKDSVEVKGKHILPHVVEPSFGADRIVYAVLEYNYGEKDDRSILRLPRDIAPIQMVVLPLVSRDGLPDYALKVYNLLLDDGFSVDYDESGSIGRRYARADEIGVPIAVTIDYQSLRDDTVTLRDRDSWKQVRVKLNELSSKLHMYFKYVLNFEDLGEMFESK